MLAVAVLHWVAFGLMVRNDLHPPATWQYSAVDLSQLASAILRGVFGAS
jgi:hypothetical protein